MKKLIGICTIIFCVVSAHGITIEQWTDRFDAVLKQHVHSSSKEGINTTLVDYDAISRLKEWPLLISELETVQKPSSLNRNDQLAFWINVYNFLTINKVAEKPSIEKLTDLNGFFKNVWKLDAGVVAGRSVTLDEVEHEIIRKEFNEPRIHVAVVCAALSCPDLRPEAYRGDRLDAQLSDQLKTFASNSVKGIAIDDSNKKLNVSKIFKWFGGDFKPNVPAWLKNQGVISATVAKDYRLTYFDYNWNLNSYKKGE